MADRKAKESATGEKGRRHLSSFEHEPVEILIHGPAALWNRIRLARLFAT